MKKPRETERLAEAVEENFDPSEQCDDPQMLRCLALYREGSLLEARAELKEPGCDRDDEGYRRLRAQIAISLGDWNELSSIVAEEFSKKKSRSAVELLEYAEIAVRLNLPCAKALTIAAAEKDDADARVLGGAHLLASSAGWNDDARVAEWLEKALALSGEDGPVRRVPVEKILNEKPEPEQPDHDIWPKLMRGEIPMFLAAESLNRSLFDFMVLPALMNPSEKDPRRRHPIPAYSGKKLAGNINADATVGIDATALITLNFLGLLDETLDAFMTVYIPHSTLAWLFEEKRRTRFRPVVPPETATETEASEYCRNISDKVDRTIESIRASLISRIESGKIKVARQNDTKKAADRRRTVYTINDTFALPGDCDMIIVDDRWVNQNLAITNIDGKQLPVFSTLDILNTLVSSQKRWRKLRTLLRRAGYFFVPVVPLELQDHLGAAAVKNGKVEETCSIRAVRENILCAQMNNWRQLPEEWFWLEESLTAFSRTLYNLWTEDADFGEARARSDWIADQIDFRALVHMLGLENESCADEKEFGRHVMETLLSGPGKSRRNDEEYWKWLEDSVLRPLKEQSPDSYRWIAGLCKEETARWTKMYMNQETNLTTTRAETVLRVLEDTVPPLIRESLLAKPDFRGEYKLGEHAHGLSFENPAVSFQGPGLFRAVRSVLSETSTEEVTDMEGGKWKLENISEKDRLPNLSLSQGDMRFSVSSGFLCLSPDKQTRLRLLKESSSESGLPDDAGNAWRKILEKRPLKYGELQEFDEDFLDTPTCTARTIRRKIRDGQFPLSSIVPSSRRYFDRLVGKYDVSATVRDYAARGGGAFLRELSRREPYDGFLSSLLLSSHPAMTAEIPVDDLDEDDFGRACDFLEKRGDKVSQLGAVEVGFRVLPSMPGIEPRLVRLIKEIRSGEADGKAGGFKLFSTLFLLANGELSQTRIFSPEPPFYRKLAALSQAALIHRQLAGSSINVDRLHDYATTTCGLIHFLQSLVDMRLEPLWLPGPWEGHRIRENFLGRIVGAATKYRRDIKNGELFNLIFGAEEGSISSEHPSSRYSLSPLDGTEDRLQDLPAKISEAINDQLGGNEVRPQSFTALVDSTRFFRIGSEQVETATKTLRRGGHSLTDVENKMRLSEILSGLATVSAATRNRALADELRIVARGYRNGDLYDLSSGEETAVCLMAAASRTDLDGWAEFVGDWMTELAFEAKEDEAKSLLVQLEYLCHIVPELWISCGRACAALKALSL